MEALHEVIERLLGAEAGNVYVCSISNNRTVDSSEKHMASRDRGKLLRFIAANDVEGRGSFFCVSTVKRGRRNKASAVETPFLFVDIDFKSVVETADQILAALAALPIPPSRIIRTGNGFHVYWYLSRSALEGDQIGAENMLRRLAWLVSGDPMVCHVAALLRIPGTHNSKRGQWIEVQEVGGSGLDYSMAHLSEWLAAAPAPVISFKPRERDSNPFLRVAEENGFRPPMDVEQSLREMTVGAGEAGIHSTQLRAAASLMSSGSSVDEAVRQIMDATEPHADSTWDMVAEEKAVRKMCTDWLRKHPQRNTEDDGDGSPPARSLSAGSSSNVRSLAQAREHREDPEDEPDSAAAPARRKKIKKGFEHVVLAPGILAALAERDEYMLYNQGRLYLYKDGLWALQTVDEEKSFVAYQVEVGCEALNIPSNAKIANETLAALRRNPTIHKPGVDWDNHGKIATKTGLVDPQTMVVERLRPDHYATTVMDVVYDPDATCPNWTRFLTELLPDPEVVSFLQECVGMAIVKSKPRTLTRALILQGPSFSGKSNVLNIIAGLIDSEVNSTALETLENSHGLVSFLKPHPWVLHEAFEQSRWEMSANVKALLSCDPVTINVKNGPLISHRYKSAVLWATNVPPQFKESSRAIETRIAIVKFKKVFDPLRVEGIAKMAEDAGFASISEMILGTESSGLLNWALQGMKRAQARGHFIFTAEMMQALERVRQDSNIAVSFFDECVEFDGGSYVRNVDVYASFMAWWEENHGGSIPSSAAFGKAVGAMADQRMMQGVRYQMTRVMVGVRLSEEGLNHWNGRANSAAVERSSVQLSDRDSDVNRTVGRDLAVKPDVAAFLSDLDRRRRG